MPDEVPIRGSWEVDQAVFARFQDAALEDAFRSAWPEDDRDSEECAAWNDSEARPATPRPYLIFEKVGGLLAHRSSGKTGTTLQEVENVPIQFTIHAESKPQAVEFCKLVADAFDNWPLDMQNDSHVQTQRGRDFGVRQADDHWIWVLPYTIQIDATYAARRGP